MPRYRIVVVATLAIMALPMAAWAGGWAIASFDDVPGQFQAGSTYDLDYTILQHGRTPVDVGSSQVRIVDSTGKVTEFDAVAAGEPGRYSVAVTFPESGVWRWEVTMGSFASHPMGTVDVAPAIPGTATGGSALRWLLPAAFVLAIGLVGVQVADLAGARRARRPVHAD